MKQYGKIIAQLRKENNMTQAELGAKLNVTYQAVSKWENDQSQPDFATMAQIAEIFHVPLTVFLGEEGEAAVPPAQDASASVVGYCTVCGNTVHAADVAQQRPLICKTCAEEKKRKQEEAARKAEEEKRRLQKEEEETAAELAKSYKRIRNIGLIAAGIISAVLLALLLLGTVGVGDDSAESIVLAILFPVFVFTFLSQMLWHRTLWKMCMAFKKERGKWGLFSIVIFIVTLPFLVVFTFVLSPFTFVSALIHVTKYGAILTDAEEEQLLEEAELDQVQEQRKETDRLLKESKKILKEADKALRDMDKQFEDKPKNDE